MNSSRPELRLDWATHDAAKYACERWHYSRCVPHGKLVRVGVWEDGRFIGVVLFGSGATPEIGKPYGLEQTAVCELVRVALTKHAAPVSRIVAIALRILKKSNPGLRLVVSFADTTRGHHGGIYQAGGWIYAGSAETHVIRLHGEHVHPRSLGSRYGVGGQSIPWLRKHVDPNAERVSGLPKHRYVMPLDDEMRKRVAQLSRPYPKRAEQSTREKQAMAGPPGTAAV